MTPNAKTAHPQKAKYARTITLKARSSASDKCSSIAATAIAKAVWRRTFITRNPRAMREYRIILPSLFESLSFRKSCVEIKNQRFSAEQPCRYRFLSLLDIAHLTKSAIHPLSAKTEKAANKRNGSANCLIFTSPPGISPPETTVPPRLAAWSPSPARRRSGGPAPSAAACGQAAAPA